MEEYERILLVKQEVFVYKLPPRTTTRGYRASDWKLDQPAWTGRLRLVAKGKECILKLEDKVSGELFATCPVDKYPGLAIEPVMDSSRYFVIRLQDGDRTAFIGIGFVDRGDSFDLNVALQDHFKWIQKSEELEQEAAQQDSKPQLDLSLKEGQTITINMNIAKKASGSSGVARQRGTKASGTGLLPPPPGSNKLPAPPATKVASAVPATTDNNLLLDLGGLSLGESSSGAPDSWGEFASSGPAQKQPPDGTTTNKGGAAAADWVDF